MAARLTATGIEFSDGTILTSKFGIIPQNSITLFYQASAPTGWTKSTSHNNKTLRVVSGTGGGSGGTTAFTSIFPNSLFSVTGTYPISGSVGDHTLTTNQIASHNHGNGGEVQLNAVPALFNPDGVFTGWNGGDVSRAAGWSRNSPGVANNGGGSAHAHPWSGNAGFSQNIDLRVQYIDVIECNFDG